MNNDTENLFHKWKLGRRKLLSPYSDVLHKLHRSGGVTRREAGECERVLEEDGSHVLNQMWHEV